MLARSSAQVASIPRFYLPFQLASRSLLSFTRSRNVFHGATGSQSSIRSCFSMAGSIGLPYASSSSLPSAVYMENRIEAEAADPYHAVQYSLHVASRASSVYIHALPPFSIPGILVEIQLRPLGRVLDSYCSGRRGDLLCCEL